ncbi:RecQ family ATP-dependent DNA helicase [Bacillus sp. Marseille-P3661]|uniref:RecQ family ATP-dependent DNA helicase n=1 Tax=Bacillus sp. Marseille-P3661 TaxID=1936234 RepID=UPI000C839BEB|nr:ATP-dependent DNA helicase RecQ [Bacillus sp. Marseille-P3661]
MNLQQVLLQKFGYSSFREGQEEIIQDILAGHNVVALLPTGAGKSICYQLPGMVVEGSVIIVSPLLSLMEDQVQQLKSLGEKRVVGLNSFLSFQRRGQVLKTLGKYRYIYVSPEILQSHEVILALQAIKVSLFVIDEAHCISQWGHEFRTDYLKLYEVKNRLGNPPCLALTATATRAVLDDIIAQLRLEEVQEHIFSIDRPNIALHVEQVETFDQKISQTIHYVKTLQGPGIIYFSSRLWAEKMSHLLQEQGIQRVAYYHGGLENENRLLIQQQFIEGQLDVICCTNAFGMGINKANVRYVVHFHYPSHLESYIQEIGRAGRDGNASIALLLYCTEDHEMARNLIDIDLPKENEINIVFDFLKQLADQQKTYNCKSFEQDLMQLFGISEIKSRYIKYQLEERKVIINDQINKNCNFQHIKNKLIHNIMDRIRSKEQDLLAFRHWIVTENCRRASLLEYFNQKLKTKQTQCCDNCGIQIELYGISPHKGMQQKKIEFSTWEKELKLIFRKSEERYHG